MEFLDNRWRAICPGAALNSQRGYVCKGERPLLLDRPDGKVFGVFNWFQMSERDRRASWFAESSRVTCEEKGGREVKLCFLRSRLNPRTSDPGRYVYDWDSESGEMDDCSDVLTVNLAGGGQNGSASISKTFRRCSAWSVMGGDTPRDWPAFWRGESGLAQLAAKMSGVRFRQATELGPNTS